MFNFFSKKSEPLKLCISTDIHCHIVPGIDDGSQEAHISVELIERMQSWGIKRIIATPHVTQDTFENTPQTITTAFENLKNELDVQNNDIKISHSAEYRIDEFLLLN